MKILEQQHGKKLKLSGLLVAFLFTSVFGFAFLLTVNPAQAQPVVTAPGSTTFDPATYGQTTVVAANTSVLVQKSTAAKVTELIHISKSQVVALAFMNALNYFVQKIAYDTANYIASGGKGQKPLFTTRGIKDELAVVGKDAAGEAIGTIQNLSGLQALGINLCAPTNPRIALNIKLGFIKSVNPPTPKCNWNQIQSNWTQFSAQNSDQVLNQVGVQFTEGNPLESALQFNSQSKALIASEESAAATEYNTNQGFKPVQGKISGDVKTPAPVVQQQLKDANQIANEQTQKNIDIANTAFTTGGYTGVFSAAIKTFTNTLTEKLMKRVFEKGLISITNIISCHDLLGKCPNGSTDSLVTNADAVGVGGRSSAELANADLLTPKIFSATNYDALLDFTSCPEGAAKGPTNCVMDGQFFAAVNRAAANQPLTLQQAIDQGFINGGWRLLPLASPKNSDRTCYLESFCYSNLAKIRAARVIPIGWELAAELSDVNNPVTLKEAMDKFNDCPFTTDAKGNKIVDGAKLPDPLHPWCRLIDPNWVLKYPKSICRQSGPGPALQDADSSVRASTCVDAPSCINEDKNGNCTGGYGYCVKERSAWQIDADSCQPQNATCQAVTRADGQSFAYLMNTVKAGICNADNAGCTARSIIANAIPNNGFEDIVGGAARDWKVTGAAGVDVTGSNAYRGMNAGYLGGGNLSVRADVLPGKQYLFSMSAKTITSVSANQRAVANISFLDQDGKAISAPLVQDCVSTAATGSVNAGVAVTNLGYQTVSCHITTPATAYAAVVSITGAGVRTYVDEVGIYGDSFSSSPLDSAFLNSKADTCDQSKVGCHALVRASTAALNLIRNPGFEDRTVDGKRPTFWTNVSDADYQADVRKSREGSAAVALPTGASVIQDVNGALPNATYTFSVNSMGGVTSGLATASIVAYGAGGAVIGSNLCLSGTGAAMPLKNGASYVQSSCAFTVPDGAVSLRLALGPSSGGTVLVDALQLELGGLATDYHDGYAASAEQLHLKVAPDGLVCTGATTDPSACSGFAKSCRREDVGCNLYTPNDGTTNIPAVTSPADECPAACDGYDDYREEPTSFVAASFPVPLIPASGRQCAAKEAGCQEFTNLEKLALGGEAREYFTGIRLCQKPDDQTATYYTWEGNDVKGYQLRVWTLRQSTISNTDVKTDPTGGTAPCTNLGYDNENKPICKDNATNIAACNKEQLKFNPDCREFYDTTGNIHYRLYSHTVLSADTCTEYRMTDAAQADCTTHGGLWTRNECHYFGYAPENVSCQASANNCRAYTGNASRNIRIAVTDNFDDGTTGAWTPNDPTKIVSSNEAVNVTGMSLKVMTGMISRPLYQNGAYAVSQGKSYLVAMWAKGTGDLTPAIIGANQAFSPVALTTDWRQYVIGPVQLDAAPSQTTALQLKFGAADAGRPAYIDNVELREISDSVYLIKGSWKTPDACDQDPNGNSAPQYMLGCKGYKNQAGVQSYQKSFARLCQEKAVGCDAFYDTHNTSSPFPETWNAVCSLTTACSISPTSGKSTCTCASREGDTCEVTPGSKSCRFSVNGAVVDSELGEAGQAPLGDVVRIKADSLNYLIDDKQYYCSAADVGCSALAKPTRDPDQKVVTGWETSYIKNDPAKYRTTLCTQPENACQAWTRAEDGTPTYFKDPENRVCTFRNDVTVDGNKTSGWFKPNSDVPCYSSYLKGGSTYGIWKNSDTQYANWVGVCEQSQSRCKEYLDPTDASPDYPQGRPYYFIANSNLDLKTCANQVSRTTAPSGANVASACALFKQTDVVNNSYDAPRSYDLSEKQFGALVTPIDETTQTHAKGTAAPVCGNANIDTDEECDLGSGQNGVGLGCSSKCLFENNTNVIIRATRDRQCAQWLDCRSSENIFNPSTGAFQNVCTGFGLCADYRKVGDTSRCVKYVDSSYKDNVLEAKIYQTRPVGWGSQEFSGDAVPYRYPLDQLKTVVVSDSTIPGGGDPRLVYANGACPAGTPDFTPCGSANNRGNAGICLSGQCTWPIDGGRPINSLSDLQQTSAKVAFPTASCRIYPKADSPFPGTVADPSGWDYSISDINGGNPRLIGPAPAFAGANVCQRRTVKIGNSTDMITYDSCECGYIEASYGGGNVKYLPLNGPDVPNGYCGDGVYQDLECDPTAVGMRSGRNLSCCSKLSNPDLDTGIQDCEDDGGCQAVSRTSYLVGYQGQCIERDLSTPINGRSDEYACANWRPTGLVGGTLDIYNLNRTAGYFAPIDRRFYCANPGPPSWIKMGIDMANDRGDFTHRICDGTGGAKHCLVNADCGSGEGSCVTAGTCSNDDMTSRGPICWTYGSDNYHKGGDGACRRIKDGNGNSAGYTSCAEPLVGDPDITSPKAELSDQGPLWQPADKFFGPGKVSQMVVGYTSQGNGGIVTGDCANAADKTGAAWCIFPGISTSCDNTKSKDATPPDDGSTPPPPPTSPNTCPEPYYALREPIAYGIVGCYELSDGETTTGDPLTIEWPYIGPNMFKDQLIGFYVELVRNLYGAAASGIVTNPDGTKTTDKFMTPTNPHQKVTSDCNDEGGGDSHISYGVAPVPIPGGPVGAMTPGVSNIPNPNSNSGLCTLNNANSWKRECSDGGGAIFFELLWDTNSRLLRGFKVTARDSNDEGTFAIKSVTFNMKAACDTVARVDEPGQLGLTKADTELVNAYRNFDGAGVPSTRFEQSCRPWGAIGSQAQNPLDNTNDLITPTRWTAVSPYNRKDPTKEDQIDQCTTNSYRQGSIYQMKSPPSPPPASLGTFGQFLNNIFHHLSKAWKFTPWSIGNVSLGDPNDPNVPAAGKPLIQQYGAIPSIQPGGYFYDDISPPTYPPQIASVDTSKCDTSGVCPVKNVNAVAVNGRDSGILTGTDGIFPANMQFYAWASHSSMPVRSRTVRWGDLLPGEPGADGWYKNRKPFCSPDLSDKNAAKECDLLSGLTCRTTDDCPNSTCNATLAGHFGNTPGACETTPYRFDHTYTCTAADLTALKAANTGCVIDSLTDRALNAPCIRKDAITGNVPTCVYRPRIQVVDNWGYCNCSGNNCPPGGFLHSTDATKDQCNIDKSVTVSDPRNPPAVPWTTFNGEIRVLPNAQDAAQYAAAPQYSVQVTPPSTPPPPSGRPPACIPACAIGQTCRNGRCR